MVYTEVPGPPEKLAVTETWKASITLTWAPPSQDGGSPVTGYLIERCLADSTRWIRVGKTTTETTYTDKEVVEDTQYLYRVAAENKVGPGPPCEPTQPVTAKDPWSKSECRYLPKALTHTHTLTCRDLLQLELLYKLLYNKSITNDSYGVLSFSSLFCNYFSNF